MSDSPQEKETTSTEVRRSLDDLIGEIEKQLDISATSDPLHQRAKSLELLLALQDIKRELFETKSASMRLDEAKTLLDEFQASKSNSFEAISEHATSVFEQREAKKNEPADYVKWIIVFVVAYLIFGAIPIALSVVGTYGGFSLVSEEALRVSGTIGDTFGAANAFFAGGALLGAITAIALQIQELRYQRAELAMTREEMRKNNVAQQGRLFYEQSFARVRQTFELHAELNSKEMMEHRNQAHTLIREDPHSTFDALESKDGYDGKYVSIWLIQAFYEKLNTAVAYGRIDPEITPTLFGELFYWWYLISFEHQLVPVDWGISQSIKQLHEWFEKNASESDKQLWTKRAKKDRQKILNQTEPNESEKNKGGNTDFDAANEAESEL